MDRARYCPPTAEEDCGRRPSLAGQARRGCKGAAPWLAARCRSQQQRIDGSSCCTRWLRHCCRSDAPAAGETFAPSSESETAAGTPCSRRADYCKASATGAALQLLEDICMQHEDLFWVLRSMCSWPVPSLRGTPDQLQPPGNELGSHSASTSLSCSNLRRVSVRRCCLFGWGLPPAFLQAFRKAV